MADREVLRVAHIVTRFGDGGSEQRVLDALRAAPEAEAIVVAGAGADFSRLPSGSGGIIEIKALVRRVSLVSDLRALFALAGFLRTEGPFDVVHTHQSKAGVLGRLAARLAAPSARTVHSYSMANFGEGYPRAHSAVFRRIELALSRWTSAYVVVGEDLSGRLVEAGLPRAKIHIVRSGIDLEEFLGVDRTRRQGPTGHGHLNLLFVGALSRRKGADRLPGLVAKIEEASGIPVQVVVAGTGECGPPQFPTDVKVGLSTLRYLGFSHDIAHLMEKADVLVLPTSAEGLPQVLVQAAAAGLPFVAYEVDGVAEMLGYGFAGIGVALGDESKFVAAVVDCFRTGDLTNDPDHAVFSEWDHAVIDSHYRELYLSPESVPDV